MVALHVSPQARIQSPQSSRSKPSSLTPHVLILHSRAHRTVKPEHLGEELSSDQSKWTAGCLLLTSCRAPNRINFKAVDAHCCFFFRKRHGEPVLLHASLAISLSIVCSRPHPQMDRLPTGDTTYLCYCCHSVSGGGISAKRHSNSRKA